MTPSAAAAFILITVIGNLAVKAFVPRRITKRQSVNSDFVFPDQLEFVSKPSLMDLRQASPAVSYDSSSFTEWDVDDGHQYRTQFTLRRAKPFGETRPRKPLTAKDSGVNKQNEILFPQEGSSSEHSVNFLATQASNITTHASRGPETSQSYGYTSSTVSSSQPYSHSSSTGSIVKSPPAPAYSQSSSKPPGYTMENYGNDQKKIQFVETTGYSNVGTTLSPGKTLSSCRCAIRPRGPQAHSTSVTPDVALVHSKPVQLDSSSLPIAPNRPFASQSSGLYFGTAETYAFRSGFESDDDDSGDDFILSIHDLVKHPFLQKLYNSDVYNGQYKTVNFQHSSSSSFSQASSSGFSSSSGGNFPKIFPAFSSSSNFGSSLGFRGRISNPSIGAAYFFQR